MRENKGGCASWQATETVPPDPLINAAAEIVGSLPNNKLRSELFADDREDLSEAVAIVQQTLREAPRWADYYQSQSRKARAIAKGRQKFRRGIRGDIEKLRGIETKILASLRVLEEPLAPIKHPLRPARIKRTVQALRGVRGRLEQMRKACSRSIPGIEGKPPTDGWYLGYIWCMALGWRKLTTLPIAARGYFQRFLGRGLAVIKPGSAPPEWGSLISTAVRRFRLQTKTPLRPGDDLTLFQV